MRVLEPVNALPYTGHGVAAIRRGERKKDDSAGSKEQGQKKPQSYLTG
jgi:hypothetical protein